MNFYKGKSLHFIGVGGTAMGATAIAASMAGYVVSGSDSGIYPPMSDNLLNHRISFATEYSADNIQRFSPDIVVVGNAVSRGNPELEQALDMRLEICSMPELVRQIFIRRHCSTVISGTHGKTTTSAMTAHCFDYAGKATGFLIGAIPGNFDVGCRLVPSNRDDDGFFISEGDEYDSAFFDKRSKFMHYRPDIAIVNNIEFDHADVFENLQQIIASFRLFLRLVPSNGTILLNGDDDNVLTAARDALAPSTTFGFGAQCDRKLANIAVLADGTEFSIVGKDGREFSLKIPVFGEHNVRNAAAAALAAERCGISFDAIRQGLASFRPPKRRMEEIAVFNGAVVIDDFAHHPTAVRETLKAVRQKHRENRIIACFEPRSNTTARNIFQRELSECFSDADIVFFGSIFRAERYAPEHRLNIDAIVQTLREQGLDARNNWERDDNDSEWGKYLFAALQKETKTGDVIVLLSNGNFGGLRALFSE